MVFVSPLSLLNQEDSLQQPPRWVFLAWSGSPKSQRANTFAPVAFGTRQGEAARRTAVEVRSCRRRHMAFPSELWPSLMSPAFPSFFVTYSKVTGLTNSTAHEVMRV